MYIHAHVHAYIHTCVYMYICMYTDTCVYIYIYTCLFICFIHWFVHHHSYVHSCICMCIDIDASVYAHIFCLYSYSHLYLYFCSYVYEYLLVYSVSRFYAFIPTCIYEPNMRGIPWSQRCSSCGSLVSDMTHWSNNFRTLQAGGNLLDIRQEPPLKETPENSKCPPCLGMKSPQ